MGTRQFRSAQGIVSAAGVCKFTFDPPPMGYVNSGTLAVYNSPAFAQWTVNLAGTPVASAIGSSPAYNVQQWANESLTVSASGLTPGQIYNCTFTYNIDAEGSQPPDSQALVFPSNQSLYNMLYPPTQSTVTNASPLVLGPFAVGNAGAVGLKITNGTLATASALTCTLDWIASDATTVLFSEKWYMYGSASASPLAATSLFDVFPPLGAYVRLTLAPSGTTIINMAMWAAGLGASFEPPSPTTFAAATNVTLAAGTTSQLVLGSTQTPPANWSSIAPIIWPCNIVLWSLSSDAKGSAFLQEWGPGGWVPILETTIDSTAVNANSIALGSIGRSSIQMFIQNLNTVGDSVWGVVKSMK